MNKIILIVAASFRSANLVAESKSLALNQWQYVNNADTLRGIPVGSAEYIITVNANRREDITKIREVLKERDFEPYEKL